MVHEAFTFSAFNREYCVFSASLSFQLKLRQNDRPKHIRRQMIHNIFVETEKKHCRIHTLRVPKNVIYI